MAMIPVPMLWCKFTGETTGPLVMSLHVESRIFGQFPYDSALLNLHAGFNLKAGTLAAKTLSRGPVQAPPAEITMNGDDVRDWETTGHWTKQA